MLFKRRIKIGISSDSDTRIFDERLEITVRVSKDIQTDEADTCEIDIINLSPESRAFIGTA